MPNTKVHKSGGGTWSKGRFVESNQELMGLCLYKLVVGIIWSILRGIYDNARSTTGKKYTRRKREKSWKTYYYYVVKSKEGNTSSKQ